jgi:hypothetical protein
VLFLLFSAWVSVVQLPIQIWAVLAPEEHGFRGTFEALVGAVEVVPSLGTPILFLMWLHRVVRQMDALGMDVGATPGWAVGYWFVPIVSMVKPYRVMKAIVERLGGNSLVASVHLGWWWAAYLVSNGLDQLETRVLLRHEFSRPIESYQYGIGASLLLIPAALLCVRIIREVQAQLDSRRDELPPVKHAEQHAA